MSSRYLGVIEGFYGRPWSQGARLAWVALLSRFGLNSYLYAPKADPWLRRDWTGHWPEADWQALQGLSAACASRGVGFGVGLSPFALYRDYGAGQKQLLRDKVRRLNELEAPLLAILFDDMPGDLDDLASRQAEIVADVAAVSRSRQLFVCPTYYSFDPVLERHFGRRPDSYWEQLGAALAPEVNLFWTGPQVCSERLGLADQREAAARLGRAITLWDNYPVNDGASRSRHLYLDPLPGREAAGVEVTRGHFCNPMNQPWCSLPGVAGLALLYATLGAQTRQQVDAELAVLMGESLLVALQEDSRLFREQGLDRIDPQQRRQLLKKYSCLQGPAAAEVTAWLRGEYTFDPACLTD